MTGSETQSTGITHAPANRSPGSGRYEAKIDSQTEMDR